MAPINNRVRVEVTIPIEFGTWDNLIRIVGVDGLTDPKRMGRGLFNHLVKDERRTSDGTTGVTIGSESRAEITRIWEEDK